MAMEKSVIPMLISEFQEIFEMTIEEERLKSINLREYRFNVARFLMDLHDELGKLPYDLYWS